MAKKKTRVSWPFPRATLEEALKIPYAIMEHNGGNPWEPDEIRTAIGAGTGGNAYYYLTAASRDYGLTTGTPNVPKIALADLGREIVYAPNPEAEKRPAAAAANIISIDVAVWRRVSCWSHAAARWPVVAGARRRRRGADPRQRQHRPFATNKRSPPTNDRRRPPRGGRPPPHRAPHRRVAQLAHPAGRSRMPIALHGLALGKASDAISPLNAVVEPGCCRTPPAAAASSAFAATARAPAFAPNRI